MSRAIVVGARCRRQGIGEFITRSLHNVGVGIAGIVGTSEATLAEARRKLETRYGIETPGFASLEAAIEKAQPDMVAICSPNGFHREQLEITARAGLHCLCEKPLWWSDDQADSRAITKALVAAFTMRNRLLDLVTQWPFTLPSFDMLHGNSKSERLQSFEMILSPRSEGEAIIPDCIPHVWSLLYAVAGGGEVRDPTIRYAGGAGREVTVRFRYAHATGDAAVTCRFVTTATKPSPAAYAINGRWMHRQVRLPDYGFEFESNGRTVPAEDPLDLLVADFIRRMHAGELTDAAKLVAAQLAVETVARMTRIE